MQEQRWIFRQEIETHLAILESLTEGIIIADLNGRFLFFNTAAVNILGIGLQHITPSEWAAVYGCYQRDAVTPFPPDDLPLARALRGETIVNDIVFIKNPDRPQGLYISISANPMRNADGLVHGGMVIFRDITESIQAEGLLKESRERINAQFKGFPIPTYVWRRSDTDFILIDYNSAAEVITKGGIKKYLGSRLSTMYSASPEIETDFIKCFDEKTMITREMLYRLRSTGVLRDMIVSYVFIHPDLVMVHAEDVTERKKVESEMKKLFNAVEQTADVVLITNKQGIIEYVNPAFETTTGFSRQEVLGRSPSILRSGKHDHTFYQKLWKTVLEGKPFMETLVNQKKNGEFFYCEQTITAVKDPESNITHFVSVAKDITQLREKQALELQLSVAQKIQQRISKAVISVPGYDIAGRTYSAVHTSGDFYDFVSMPDGCTGLVIGDVCGKGIGAALIMAETRAYLRAFAKLESDPAAILDRLNVELFADLEDTQFVTLILARLDSKNNILHYASAGHGTAYLLDNEGKVALELESTGIPLGYIKDYKYENGTPAVLTPGSVLVFMTDGIGEAIDAQENEFGDQRAVDEISRNRHATASEIIECLYQAVVCFSDKNAQMDDITSVICKVLP